MDSTEGAAANLLADMGETVRLACTDIANLFAFRRVPVASILLALRVERAADGARKNHHAFRTRVHCFRGLLSSS